MALCRTRSVTAHPSACASSRQSPAVRHRRGPLASNESADLCDRGDLTDCARGASTAGASGAENGSKGIVHLEQRTGPLEHQTGQGDEVQANLILPSGDRHMTTIIPTPPATHTGESSRGLFPGS